MIMSNYPNGDAGANPNCGLERGRSAETVLKLIDTGTLTESVQDWYAFIGFCDFHRMTGYLADRLIAMPEVPAQVKRHARIQKAYQAHKQESLIGAAKELSARLEANKIPHAFLKGVVLAGEIYGAGERCSNDVDILALPKDVGKISDILKSIGYVQGLYRDGGIMPFDRLEIVKRRMNRGETAPFVRLNDDPIAPFVEVDINFSLNWLPTDADSLTETFLYNTVISKNGLRALDTEYTLIYLCLHLYKEAVVYSMVKRLKDIELYKYGDIFKMLKRIGVKRFWHFADKYGLRKQCEYAIWQTNQLFPSSDFWLKEPSDINLVIDPENGDREYIWDMPFLERVFDTNRLRQLRAKDEG
jgi:hypothetical protein